MREKSRFLKVVSMMTLMTFIFMTISSCSWYPTSWISQKFWSMEKQSGMDEKDVNRFVGKLRMRPGNPDSHYLLACYHQERGKHKEAIDEFGKVLFIDPSHVNAYNGKGISHDQLGEYPRAVESYQKALSLEPNLDYVLNNLGYSYVLQGNYAAAVETFSKASILNEKDSRIRNNLAMAYAMAGHYDQAFHEFETAGKGDKGYAHLKLAAVYYEKAMFRQAAENYKLALALNASPEAARKGLEASEELMKISEAVARHVEMENTRAAQEEDIMNPVIVGMMAAAPQNDIVAADHVQSARKLYEEGSFKEARQQYSHALALNPALGAARKGLVASESLARIADASSPGTETAQASSGEVKAVLAAGKDLQKAGIEVSNGNGKSHMARDIRTYLKAQGFSVVRVTNARHFNHAEGSIHYEKEYRDVAMEIAGQIPQIKDMKEVDKCDRPNVKVKVLIGKDLIAYRQDYRN